MTVPLLDANSTVAMPAKLQRHCKGEMCVFGIEYTSTSTADLMYPQGLYLEHLASDWKTHWPTVHREPDDDGLADRPGKLRKILQTGLFDLFRPRLEAFFDMELPTEEDKRDDGEDEVLSREKYTPIFADRLGRIAFIESATVAAVSSQNLGLQRMVLMP